MVSTPVMNQDCVAFVDGLYVGGRRSCTRYGCREAAERATPPCTSRNGPCLVSAPQRTAPEDGKGRGSGGVNRTTGRRSGRPPLPSRSSSSCRSTKSPAVPGHPVWVSRGSHRWGFSGTWRSTPSISVLTCRFSMLRCADAEPTGGIHAEARHFDPRAGYRSAQDLSGPNPTALCGQASSAVRNSWWEETLCSRLPSRSLTFQFLALAVIVEVFKVSPTNRIQQRPLSSRSLTFLFPVEMRLFKCFSALFPSFKKVRSPRGGRVRLCTCTRRRRHVRPRSP